MQILKALLFSLIAVSGNSLNAQYTVKYIVYNNTPSEIQLDEDISNGELDYISNHHLQPNDSLVIASHNFKHKNDYQFSTGHFTFNGELSPNINDNNNWKFRQFSRKEAHVIFEIESFEEDESTHDLLDEEVIEEEPIYHEIYLDEQLKPEIGIDSLFKSIQAKFTPQLNDEDIRIYVQLTINQKGDVEDVIVLKSNRDDLKPDVVQLMKSIKWSIPKHKGQAVKAHLTFPVRVNVKE